MSKHTPWKFRETHPIEGFEVYEDDPETFPVCTVVIWSSQEPEKMRVKQEGHAHLISTSPELLEKLKASNEALSTLADCWHCEDKVNFLKLLGDNNDAIAKAEGLA